MSTIYPLAQTLFINKQNESSSYEKTHNNNGIVAKKANSSAAIDGDFIKIGDSSSFLEAQHMFERANQYEKMSVTAQNGLQAYTSIDASNRREAVRQLMGVDLYA